MIVKTSCQSMTCKMPSPRLLMPTSRRHGMHSWTWLLGTRERQEMAARDEELVNPCPSCVEPALAPRASAP